MRQSVADQMHKLWMRNKGRTSFHDQQPERWFVRELQLIDPGLTIAWGRWIDRWIIYCQGEPSHIVQNPDESFRQPDQRILRKLRVDHLLTYSEEALEAYLDGDNYALSKYVQRGLDGVRDYLELKVGE